MNDNEARKYLTAFADGELDVDTNLRVLEYMKMHRDAADRVMHQQQLRDATARVMRAQSPAPPVELQEQVEAMVNRAATTPASLGRVDRSVGRSGRRWLPALAAAAALMLVTTLVALYLPGGSGNTGEVVLNARAGMIARHEQCARNLDMLQREGLEQSLEAVPTSVYNTFNQQAAPGLDLSSLGYVFEGIGHCTAPGGKALHLMYVPSDDAAPQKTISLWVRPDDGKVDIQPGRLYRVTGDQADMRVLVWKGGNMMYYLVGAQTSKADEAARMMLASAR